MRKEKLLILFIAMLPAFFHSCEKDPLEDWMKQDIMIINNDLSLLSQRVKTIEGNSPMPLYPVDYSGPVKSLKSDYPDIQYEIYLRAEVDPPSYNGRLLQASHVKIVGNYAYVTYNTKGDEYLGGAEIYDVSDIKNPRLISQAVFPEKDISSIDVESLGSGNNNFVYVTGAYNLEFDTLNLKTPAVVERLNVNAANQFMHLENPRRFYDLPSYAGNDVSYHSQNIYATSGSGGGLTVLNNGLNIEKFIDIPYTRSVDTDGNRVIVFSALDSRIHVMDMNGNQVNEIEAGGEHFEGDQYLEAKSIVRLSGDLAFLATGTGGMEIYNINTGQKEGSLPRPIEWETADTPLNYVSNGVSVNEKLVLVANGGSGVHIAELKGTENGLRTIGKFMFEYGSSANFVEARDNKVFVATGKGGLKILEIVAIESTEPCETLWGNIVELFPERESIHEGVHPAHDLFDENLPGTIRLTEDAPVYITFIHNGAGWHNSFGYYYYNENDIPSSAEELNNEIVYAYVNKYTYGELAGQPRVQGDRIRLGGNDMVFEEGTVIGFYIVAKGWDTVNEKMTEGIHTVYTTPEFNRDGVRKHVLFLEQSCLDIVLGFEDMLDGSDEDFNDIIFSISNGDDVFGNETNWAIDIEGLPVK